MRALRSNARLTAAALRRGHGRARILRPRHGAVPAGTPRAVAAAWLASPAHRAVLLSPLYRHAGIAVAAGTPFGGPGGTFVLDLGDH